MPKRYAREFRRAVSARLVAGEQVSSLSKEFGGVGRGPLSLEAPSSDVAGSWHVKGEPVEPDAKRFLTSQTFILGLIEVPLRSNP